MKIGVVTFWWSQDNYGQLLQCYATLKHLQKLGHEAYLIRIRDFHEESSQYPTTPISIWRKAQSILHWKFLLRSLFRKLYHPYINKHIQNHNIDREFDHFREKYITCTKQIYSHDDLQQESLDVDILATGSDMTWGVGIHHNEYLLDFGKPDTRKISISASFGRTWERLTDTEKNIYKKFISKYEAVTVREEEGVKICRNLGVSNVTRVCDPTMLLYYSDYEELMRTARIPDTKDKVFIYYIGYDESFLSDYNIVSVLKQKQLLYHYAPVGLINALPKVFPTIPQWLRYIHDSRFIITNSFHGVLFCLLFKKQFAVIPLKVEQRNTRIQTILKEFALENRICRTNFELASAIDEKIDYKIVSTAFLDFQNKSRGTIFSILNNSILLRHK